MSTQTTISILGNHRASLKQVRFQPGANNNSVLATSSRDGSIQIWDLRVNGYDGPSHNIYTPVDSGRPNTRSSSKRVQYARCINPIFDAHKPRSRQASTIGPCDTPSRGETAGRIGDVSVTAIQFLGPGLEHLLVSASEADSSIKLWDIRALATKRKIQTPLSFAQQPQSHSKWRHFGISSLNINSDGSRLYSLCKDNTVYAYSTAHLMLGHTPELSATSTSRPSQRATQEGLGPLYGFRHSQLHATSFYVKSAIRKPKDGKCEMLAVGSSDGCAILFPTDERYFSNSRQREDSNQSFSSNPSQTRPALRRVGSGLSLRLEDSIPISTHGTPLKRGHEREVGSLTWTSEGELITVGDDYLVRCWREGDEARNLRTGGEGEGRRWGCGWAEVSEKYDDDEC
jgi:WD40 repeat protein